MVSASFSCFVMVGKGLTMDLCDYNLTLVLAFLRIHALSLTHIHTTLDHLVVTPLFYVLGIAFLYFPVLACVDAPIPFIGHAVGLPYTCLLYVHRELYAQCPLTLYTL